MCALLPHERFRDLKSEYDALNCVVFGVSADSEASHTSFIADLGLNFSLLADTNKWASVFVCYWSLLVALYCFLSFYVFVLMCYYHIIVVITVLLSFFFFSSIIVIIIICNIFIIVILFLLLLLLLLLLLFLILLLMLFVIRLVAFFVIAPYTTAAVADIMVAPSKFVVSHLFFAPLFLCFFRGTSNRCL